MMHEKEIRAKYETLQSDTHVSDELKRKTLAQARAAEKAGPVGVATGHPARPAHSTSGTIVGRPARPRHAHGMRRRILVAAAAACLAVVMLGLGISVLPKNETSPASMERAPVFPFDFSIQAYAYNYTTNQAFNPNPDHNGVLIFENNRLTEMYHPGDAESLGEFGWYATCVFSVKGEGITRMQVETSKGELYRYTSRQLVGGEDPEFVQAARAWKPTHGVFLGEYDNVDVRVPLNYLDVIRSEVSEDEMRARLYYSAETDWHIGLMKRLGSVADITVDATDSQQAEDYLFGLWTNEGPLNLDGLLDSFDGETLTVTVWFEDGHQSAVTIELDPVDVMCKPIYTDAFGESHVIGYEFTDEIVDRNNLTDQQFDEIYNTGNYVIMHTLRGTVIDSTVSANE
jgi:hypothetical protein